MKNADKKKSDLRRKAEALLTRKIPDLKNWNHEDLERLVLDLEVHRIELELQNEELKQTRSELQQARDDYADLYEFAPLGYLTLDGQNVISKANFMAKQLLDTKGQRGLTGQRFTTFIDRASTDSYYLHCRKALATGLKQDCAVVMRPAGGGSFHACLESTADQAGGLRIVLIDITRRRQVEEDLRKRSEQLETANQELDAFNYSIAHDLRSPLRAIDGFARMLQKTADDKFNAEEKRELGVIRNNVRKMARLIDDLLALSRLGRQAMTLSLINMDDLVRQVWDECCEADAGRGLKVKIGPLPPAYGDAELVRLVFLNLMTNAVKFTKLQKKTVIEIGGREEERETVYFIKDNGVGFNMDYKDKLFGLFQRLHGSDEFEGTGVGLAIAQRIIHRHGGRIWAAGKENEGATFSFALPRKVASLSEQVKST